MLLPNTLDTQFIKLIKQYSLTELLLFSYIRIVRHLTESIDNVMVLLLDHDVTTIYQRQLLRIKLSPNHETNSRLFSANPHQSMISYKSFLVSSSCPSPIQCSNRRMNGFLVIHCNIRHSRIP